MKPAGSGASSGVQDVITASTSSSLKVVSSPSYPLIANTLLPLKLVVGLQIFILSVKVLI